MSDSHSIPKCVELQYHLEQHCRGHGRWHYQENIQFCRISRGSTEELIDDFNTCIDEEYGDFAYVMEMKKEAYALIADQRIHCVLNSN